MKAAEFCYWLQGLFELGEPVTLDEKQTELVKRHLNMVFVHDIDPARPPEQHEDLAAAHRGERRPRVQRAYLSGGDDVLIGC